jgi:hypothetical protein
MKMNGFFTFLFNFDVLTVAVREEWIKYYDFNFIDDKVINGLKNNFDRLTDLLSILNQKAYPNSMPSKTQEVVNTLENNNNNNSTTLSKIYKKIFS